MVQFTMSERLLRIPEYIFVKLSRKKEELLKAGRNVIDLSIGDPDMPTPSLIIESLKKAVDNPAYHKYSPGKGFKPFREAAARFYRNRYGVELDPETEIHALIGTKEGLGHLSLAILNPGDVALVPDPGYPAYAPTVGFAGGEVVRMPLVEKNEFLPELDAIPESVLKRTRLIFVNYPNNPTGAPAPLEFFQKVCDLARSYNFVVCQDNAYGDVFFEGDPPPSILNVPGAKEVAVEFYSLSKTFNMTGWRSGFVVGNREVVAGLSKVKSNLDSGVFGAVQAASITALDNYEALREIVLDPYRERRELLLPAIRAIGWHTSPKAATFYCWTRYSGDLKAFDLCLELMDKTGIIATPGTGFGETGEGFIRFSLTAGTADIRKAAALLIEAYS